MYIQPNVSPRNLTNVLEYKLESTNSEITEVGHQTIAISNT